MTTVYQTPAEYFAAHTVRPVWGGTEFKTYLAPDVAVKVLSRKKMTLSTMWNEAGKAASPNELAKTAQQTTDAIADQKFDQLFALKGRLGDHVVPFEIPDTLKCRVRSFWPYLWIWAEKNTFHSPVVQLRIEKRNLLPNKLAKLRNAHEYDKMQVVLDSALGTMANLVRAGFFPHDNQPGNFCLIDGAVKLLDLGAVWRMGKNVRGMLEGNEKIRDEYVQRNYGRWLQAIRGQVPLTMEEDLDQVSRLFWARFNQFNTWKHVHQLQVRGRRRKGRKNGNGTRVPDVFPLSP